MLTKNFYDDLKSVSEMEHEGYPEDKRPAFLTGNHERYLLQRDYLERLTLVPPEKEEDYPDGYSMIAVSPLGYYALEQYAEQKAKEKRENRQFWITVSLAFLALPGIIDGLAQFIKLFL